MYQNIPTKVLTGEVRLSYAHLTAPYANPNQANAEPKYSVTLLIPKTDTATVADINAAMEAAAQAAVNTKWGGFRPPHMQSVMHDGDGTRDNGTPYGDECKGHWVMTASCKQTAKPHVVHYSNVNVELAPADIYSGMYARVTLNFYGYSTNGKKGVACGLGNIMKTREGEPLSGQASAASDFAGVGLSPDPATPEYGAAMPATPTAGYPGASVQNAAPTPGYTAGTVNPITGLPF